MRLLLLVLGLLATVTWAQNPSPIVARDLRAQYTSYEVHSRCAGCLPLRAVVKFVPSINLEAKLHSIILQQASVVPTISPGSRVTDGWSLFIPRVNILGFLFAISPFWGTVDLSALINAIKTFNPNIPFLGIPSAGSQLFGGRLENLQDIQFSASFGFNFVSTTPASGRGILAPIGRGSVSNDGKLMMIQLEEGGALMAGVSYEMLIPQRFLSPNLEFPQQTVTTTLGFVPTNDLGTVILQILGAVNQAVGGTIPIPDTTATLISVIGSLISGTGILVSLLDGLLTSLYIVPPLRPTVPLTYTVPEHELSTLMLVSAVPSSTVQSAQLDSLTLTFILGSPLEGERYIGVEADQDIFAGPNDANAAATVQVGFNCGAFPSLCCSASKISSRPQGTNDLTGVTSPTQGWSQMRITLLPKGCFLPKDKVIVVVITRVFLGKNPTIPNRWQLNTRPVRYSSVIPVNIRLFTSAEPHPVNVARLGEPRHPYQNSITIAASLPYSTSVGTLVTPINPANVPLFTTAVGFVSRQLFIIGAPWSSYVVGSSTIKSFSAVPDTKVTNVVPSQVTFTLELGSVNIANRSAATVNGIVISANQGVFRPNTGGIDRPFPATIITPPQCETIWYMVNAYGTLVVMLNPLFDTQGLSDESAACQAALQTGATVSFIIPGTAFLPNLATGSNIYFDVRMVDPFSDRSLFLSYYQGYTGPQLDSVDTATAMMLFGWQTTAACGSSAIFGYEAGSLTSITAQSVADRCILVAEIAAISPVSAGIIRCPDGAAAIDALVMVSFVKVPEAAWQGANWPWSWAPNTAWPIVVSLPNTVVVAITNFGWIIDSPMFAVVVSYAPVSHSLRLLGVSPNIPATWTLLLVVRIDRMTESCQVVLTNPWGFQVTTTSAIVQCLFFPATGSNNAGTPLNYVSWGARRFLVPADGAVVCWTSAVESPKPDDDSDEALLGLLALIAIPVLLLCCLLALLWFLRPKREPPCCVPEAPVQEMYWVNSQPAPVYEIVPPCSAAASTFFVQ